MPKTAVVLATYNGEKLLEKQLILFVIRQYQQIMCYLGMINLLMERLII